MSEHLGAILHTTPQGARWLGRTLPRSDGGARRQAPHDAVPDERAALAERIAAPLRRAERLPPDFEGRLMAAVRAAPPASAAPRAASGTSGAVSSIRVRRALDWWRRPRTVRISPLVGLAAAAGIAGVASVSTLETLGRQRGEMDTRVAAATAVGAAEAPLPSAPESVHVVRFVLVEPEAKHVALVGDFNGWSPDVTPLAASEARGVWTVSVPLPLGRHEYAFVVDGTRWTADPFAPTVRDEFATESSVLTVGAPSDRRT
jgi:hypothetical protein